MTLFEAASLIVAGLGSLATTTTLLFGFHSYRSTNLQTRFNNLRVDLIEFVGVIRQIDGHLDAPLFIGIAREFRKEILDLVPDRTTDSLIDLFRQKENHSDVGRALVLAAYEAREVKEVKTKLTNVTRIIAKNKSSFPVSFLIIDRCVRILTTVFQNLSQPSQTMIKMFSDDDALNSIIKELEKVTQFENCVRMAEALASDFAANYLENEGQSLIDALILFMDLVLERLSDRTDQQLARISRHEQASNTTSGNNETLIIDALDAWLSELKPTFSEKDWDVARKSLGKLDQIMRH